MLRIPASWVKIINIFDKSYKYVTSPKLVWLNLNIVEIVNRTVGMRVLAPCAYWPHLP